MSKRKASKPIEPQPLAMPAFNWERVEGKEHAYEALTPLGRFYAFHSASSDTWCCLPPYTLTQTLPPHERSVLEHDSLANVTFRAEAFCLGRIEETLEKFEKVGTEGLVLKFDWQPKPGMERFADILQVADTPIGAFRVTQTVDGERFFFIPPSPFTVSLPTDDHRTMFADSLEDMKLAAEAFIASRVEECLRPRPVEELDGEDSEGYVDPTLESEDEETALADEQQWENLALNILLTFKENEGSFRLAEAHPPRLMQAINALRDKGLVEEAEEEGIYELSRAGKDAAASLELEAFKSISMEDLLDENHAGVKP